MVDKLSAAEIREALRWKPVLCKVCKKPVGQKGDSPAIAQIEAQFGERPFPNSYHHKNCGPS